MEPQFKNKRVSQHLNAPKIRRTRGKGRKTREQRLLEEQATKLADALNTDNLE